MNSPIKPALFTEKAAGLLQTCATLPWAEAKQQQARQALDQLPYPDRKQEAWKYTSALSALPSLERPAASAQKKPAASLPLTELDSWRVVFYNGYFCESLSRLPTSGALDITPFSQSTDTALQEQLGSLADQDSHPFALLNTAALHDGVFIQLGKNQCADKPVQLLFIGEGEQPSCQQARVLLTQEPGSELELIEQYVAATEQMINAVVEIKLAANATLNHYRLQLEQSDSLHISNVQIQQQADSVVNGFHFMTGNTLRRNDIQCQLQQSGAELNLTGVFLARQQQHIDNHVCVEHQAPNCQSHQVYKGIIGDQAHGVFNGRIHILPGAHGTDADLSNNNLLLSNQAEIDTKPELEIYNDDVKCAHGTTVGQLDHKACFYLQSRGISKQNAELMLSLGFITELIEKLPNPAIHDWLKPQLIAYLQKQFEAA